jgi:N-acetylgalactosamine kinase
MHVYGEAQRVYDFKQACTLEPSLAFEKLGYLMNESHASCRDLYDCSSPELDELTDLCRRGGAYGSRLTGAGWGGCAVSLIPKDKLEQFLNEVKANYYSKNSKLQAQFSRAAFATKPSSGIAVILP